MKTFLKVFFIALLFNFSTGCEEFFPIIPQPPSEDTIPSTRPDFTVGDWNLVWHDEFDDLDQDKWTVVDAPSGINNDLAYLSPDNVSVRNGKLRIRADNNAVGDRNFTGGKVFTKDKFAFTYGRVAVRARTASTYGTHTAAWLLNSPCDGINPCVGGWPPEIDIVEMIGRELDKVHQTVHYGTTPYEGTTGGRWPDWAFDVTTTTLYNDQLPGQAFHEYVVEWEENEIRWYIDGLLTKAWSANNTDSFMPEEAMYIILDVVVGGDWAQAPNETSTWPQYAEFDYVRVYQKDEDRTDPPVPTETTTYRIRNAASGRYLTADGSEEEWLTPFQADLDTSYTTQIWTSTEVEEGFFTLTPQWPTNRVLTAEGQGGDSPVYQAAYQGWGTQHWKFVEAEDNTVRLVPQWPDNVTLTTTSDDNWSMVKQNIPSGNDQERWYLEEVE